MASVLFDAHPLLEAVVFTCRFPDGLGSPSSDDLAAMLAIGVAAPIVVGENNKKAVRDLLRHGGFKPAGRSKPACEYLIKAAEGGFLGPINKAVDVCNVVSLHSGLPISVVDLDRVQGRLTVGVAEKDAKYIFNASGQEMDIGGLLCLSDQEGPCANAVKDSQRTKTHDDTQNCLYLIWGTSDLPGLTERAEEWVKQLLLKEGALDVCRLSVSGGPG